MVAKLWAIKVGSQKKFRPFSQRLRFRQLVNRRYSSNPGSIPGLCKLWGPIVLFRVSRSRSWKDFKSIFLMLKYIHLFYFINGQKVGSNWNILYSYSMSFVENCTYFFSNRSSLAFCGPSKWQDCHCVSRTNNQKLQ